MKRSRYSETKSESFQKCDHSKQQGQIASLVQGHPEGLSRSEIAHELGVGVHCVTAAVRKLLDAGILVEGGTKTDPKTGRRVWVLVYPLPNVVGL